MDIQTIYKQHCSNPSDINEHLPTIKEASEGRKHVVELGVRSVVSTWAILAGKPEKVTAYDIDRHPNVALAEQYALSEGIDFKFVQADTRSIENIIEPSEVMILDTLHTYKQLYTELTLLGDTVSRYMILHDTATFAERDMEDVYNLNTELYVECADKHGLIPAVNDYLSLHPEWRIHHHFTNNNGLMVLKRT